MATDGSNTNDGGSAPGDGTSHLILQGKDGVGKSRVASWLTEFLISRGQVRCIDGDLVNRSVSQYKTLGGENLDLVKEDGLNPALALRLAGRAFSNVRKDAFVVDSGATAFLPFWIYIVESALIRVPREAGRKVYTRASYHRLQSQFRSKESVSCCYQ